MPLLSDYVSSLAGIMNGDSPKFIRNYWELPEKNVNWVFLQSTVSQGTEIGGLEFIIYFDEEKGHLREEVSIRRLKLHNADERGNSVWGKNGVAISQMSSLPASRYFGNKYDSNVATIVPKDSSYLEAIWAFCSSVEFFDAIRSIDRKLNVTNATFGKIPFDLAHWQQIAAEKYTNGLPKPHSDDPTQWLFNGHPQGSEQPLQVAVARLLGYRWPRQTGSEFPDCPALGPDGLEAYVDSDGIVCLPPINREQAAAVRLRVLLASAFANYPVGRNKPALAGVSGMEGEDAGNGREATLFRPTSFTVSDSLPSMDAGFRHPCRNDDKNPNSMAFDETALLAAAGAKSKTLEDWLRDEFFEQHCKLFHHRPFVWHIWDGRKDGFHALVNYHQLDYAKLSKLTYSYLGDWIRQQEADAKADKPGAAERLGAARALEAELIKILEGEPPHDLFIRWKPLKDQPIGWQPDLNDGVRLNIRPFMLAADVAKKGAGVLRAKPNIKWEKDRGNEPQRDKAEFPWFWHEEPPPKDCLGGQVFIGNRWNDVHFTLARKKAAKEQKETN